MIHIIVQVNVYSHDSYSDLDFILIVNSFNILGTDAAAAHADVYIILSLLQI